MFSHSLSFSQWPGGGGGDGGGRQGVKSAI